MKFKGLEFDIGNGGYFDAEVIQRGDILTFTHHTEYVSRVREDSVYTYHPIDKRTLQVTVYPVQNRLVNFDRPVRKKTLDYKRAVFFLNQEKNLVRRGI